MYLWKTIESFIMYVQFVYTQKVLGDLDAKKFPQKNEDNSNDKVE